MGEVILMGSCSYIDKPKMTGIKPVRLAPESAVKPWPNWSQFKVCD